MIHKKLIPTSNQYQNILRFYQKINITYLKNTLRLLQLWSRIVVPFLLHFKWKKRNCFIGIRLWFTSMRLHFCWFIHLKKSRITATALWCAFHCQVLCFTKDATDKTTNKLYKHTIKPKPTCIRIWGLFQIYLLHTTRKKCVSMLVFEDNWIKFTFRWRQVVSHSLPYAKFIHRGGSNW